MLVIMINQKIAEIHSTFITGDLSLSSNNTDNIICLRGCAITPQFEGLCVIEIWLSCVLHNELTIGLLRNDPKNRESG